MSQSLQPSTSVSPGNCGTRSLSPASASIATTPLTRNDRRFSTNSFCGVSSEYAISTRPPSPAPIWSASQRNEFRSEEHTSELQSHSDLVCRLLLEKKKKKKQLS